MPSHKALLLLRNIHGENLILADFLLLDDQVLLLLHGKCICLDVPHHNRLVCSTADQLDPCGPIHPAFLRELEGGDSGGVVLKDSQGLELRSLPLIQLRQPVP